MIAPEYINIVRDFMESDETLVIAHSGAVEVDGKCESKLNMIVAHDKSLSDEEKAKIVTTYIGFDKWLIWSEEHRGWWAPRRSGYVLEKSEAGRYSFVEACEIVKGANINENNVPNEAMIRV